MPFENLQYRFKFSFTDLPERWIPLINLYDPDLPLFPIYYFHAIPELPITQIPSETERVYGYIEKLIAINNTTTEVTLITNKNLNDPTNSNYKTIALNEIRERFGVNNPVVRSDISNVFSRPLNYANNIMDQLWSKVVTNAYGDKLPFGRLWDEVFGLSRFVASWNSEGRKSELIQTHYFSSKFGEKISSDSLLPQIDFYLLPTIKELINSANNLNIFPNYKGLAEISNIFQNHYCTLTTFDGLTLSKFNNPYSGSMNTAKINTILNGSNIPLHLRQFGIECYNAFFKGPVRPIIFFMMLSDLRNGRLNPASLTSVQLGSIYEKLERTYQSPKVIHIYAQQSFGHQEATPIDIWIKTFFKWPLKIYPIGRVRNALSIIFNNATNLGKAERLIWVAVQARKVHSSVCNDAIWCIKKSSKSEARGANPLACKICLANIRNVCPAYEAIKSKTIAFNSGIQTGVTFYIKTSSANNTSQNQKFLSCEGESIYIKTVDDFSPSDAPSGLASYPQPSHNGSNLTVQDFINTY